jgi:protein-tyrosine kinase
MSRIHEALLKAEQERNTGQIAERTSLSARVATPGLVEENRAPANAADAFTRTGIVIPPPSSAYLRFDSVVAHCAHPQWHPEPKSNVFLNSAAGVPGAEQFRTLRTRLYRIRGDKPTYSLLVTSSLPDEGKTFVTNNLAQAIVQQPHHRTLLIDADLRYPQLHLALGAPLTPGLSDYLRGETDELSALQHSKHENLCFMPGGSLVPNASELLCNGKLKVLLERLTPIFDWVILDSPPCLPVADATVLAGLCDGVLLVVRAGSTPVDVAQKARQQLQGQNIVGVVLNRAEKKQLYGSHDYGCGYGKSTNREIPRLDDCASSPH